MDAFVPFVLLSSQRSGSSWLTDLLASHPSIQMFAEVFLDRARRETDLNRHLLPPLRFHEYRRDHRCVRPWATWRYLDVLMQDASSCEAVGFKLMYAQALRLPELTPGLLSRGFRVVHLVRENALDVLISREMMRRHRRVHASETPGRDMVALDTESLPAQLRQHLRMAAAARTALRALRMRVHEVRYEQLAADPRAELRRIFGFLELSGAAPDLESRYVRVNTGSQREKISNYDEVAAALETTSFRRFLH